MPSNQLSVVVAVLAAAATVAIALPVSSIHKEGASGYAPPPPAPGTSCMMLNETTCVANTCCNWCAPSAPIPPIANVTIGFCMPMIPVPPTPTPGGGLVCDKTPTDCKLVTAMSSCNQFPECAWVPFGPPGTPAGMCVYNWTRCKSPFEEGIPEAHEEAALARLAHKKAAELAKPSLAPVGTSPAPTPKPPKPTMCNMTTGPACDDCECCQWCSTVFNATGGFCMTLGPFPPPPALNCSKGAVKCEAFKTMADCQDEGLCAWLPVSPTKGKCLFNWNKCKLPPSYGPEM
uniref:Uncharacterized protein n=1 Tax=Hemiselmis andersenii TaxID=464988 RepID=A0A6U2G2C1_HEMAN|mmetsp:Transcript_35029/g.82098  ORF Transcript_35029/g.82098 Transcript_35029/m.82098 type:complete len:289 (+) Transcript_35029:68-934(+)|eukprot:CAMPEP_0114135256 /NCGR_PEP_ID=MMETSP0043_2-20121206/14604_1 /TAXON_ID=464988 /ORGANISM="Hemiselmis andersenii, Strain CCMP644" /LENGTH=288 /DNA_ID=CAMNT_0001228971 /DNA_START=57 /DNA_END=923 /DNA_ORIENTATION=-